MTVKRERLLVWVLRYVGTMSLLALVAVFMPQGWMDATHRAMDLGPLPDAPVVGYLARSLSAFYAMLGALLWYLSFDVRRHRGPLGFLAWLVIGFGGLLLIVDFREGMPAWWTLGEGPFTILFGVVVRWLNRIPASDGESTVLEDAGRASGAD